MADGMRTVFLKPDWPKGHCRYIQALTECGETERAELARQVYSRLPRQCEQEPLTFTGEKCKEAASYV